MDRIFSDEEKVRRAIEISQRRNQNYYTKNATRVNVNNKKNYKLFKKMILQIIICLLIYIIFHLISTTNYTFSSEVLRNTNNIVVIKHVTNIAIVNIFNLSYFSFKI